MDYFQPFLLPTYLQGKIDLAVFHIFSCIVHMVYVCWPFSRHIAGYSRTTLDPLLVRLQNAIGSFFKESNHTSTVVAVTISKALHDQ